MMGEAAPLLLQAPCVPPRPRERGRIEPISADEYQLRAHLSEQAKREYDELAGLLARRVPDRDPSKLLAIMITDSLEVQRRRRGLEEPSRPRAPAPEKQPTPGTRQPVPAEVRRQVLERDGHQCTFTSLEGERCPSTEDLEMDHIEGALVTGSSRPEELRTRCRPHNLYLAFLKFGRAFMERKLAERRAPPGTPLTVSEPVARYGAAA